MMDWIIPILAVAVMTAIVLLKRMSFVPDATAWEHLNNGALIIDVRSPEEFRQAKIPGAINLPLGEVREKISQRVKDKNQPLLVHCLSGGRSAIARLQLRRLGYTKVYNLGSLARARQIVNAQQKD